jgi:YfiH family protein
MIMLINLDAHCSIFFGDALTCHRSFKDEQFPLFCNKLRQSNDLSHLIILKQTHSTIGWFIHDINQLSKPILVEEQEGDYLITNQNHVGIGVSTADCLPIVYYIPSKKIVAIAHAGWRGSVAKIAAITLQELCRYAHANVTDVFIFLGPSAKQCCYEVTSEFLDNLTEFPYKNKLIRKEAGKIYFDNPLLNKLILMEHGVRPKQINDQYNACTVCNHQYHSYRRAKDKKHYQIQTTIVWLT